MTTGEGLSLTVSTFRAICRFAAVLGEGRAARANRSLDLDVASCGAGDLLLPGLARVAQDERRVHVPPAMNEVSQ
jgi:hypothetical protein